MPEIPAAVVDSIASWRRTVSGTSPDIAGVVLRNAAVDLFNTRRINKSVYPETDTAVNQEIADSLDDMAVMAGIDPDDAQRIFADAAHAATSANGFASKREPPLKPPFTLTRFNAVQLSTTAAYLVKDLIPAGGLTVIWGPPKCGKSFWTFDLSMHIALGKAYRGRRVQQGAVVYLALEGGHGFRARIEGWRREHKVADAPFYLITDRTDLIRDHAELVAAIRAQAPDLPRLVVIDTLNRSLAGSESKDEDMGAFIRAADAVREALNCAVLIVHHCGVDSTRMRGHTSLAGAVDAQHGVVRDGIGNIIVTVEWLKDGLEGDAIYSALERVELGTDDDGDPITTCVVVPVEGAPPKASPDRKLSDRQRLAVDALEECLSSPAAHKAPAAMQLPASIMVVPIAAWRDEMYSRGVLDRDAKSPREDFRRVRNSLQTRGLIGVHSDLVWRA